jgi:hypothetical protein
MPSYDAAISIGAPGGSVWRVLAAVVAWPEWLPTVNSVQPLDGSQLKAFPGQDCESTAAPVSCPSMLEPRRSRAAFSNLGEFTVPARSRDPLSTQLVGNARGVGPASSTVAIWRVPRDAAYRAGDCEEEGREAGCGHRA